MRIRSYQDMRNGLAEIPADMREVMDWIRKTYQYTGDEYDWVPNHELRLRYGRAMQPQRFGVACGLGFADLDTTGLGARRVLRRLGGEGNQYRGWAGVKGPGSIRSPETK